MDYKKCQALKAELAAMPEPRIIPIAQFFNGNDHWGSIGCNLIDHPGIDMFHGRLTSLLQSPRIESVYARIADIDPGEDSWPFTDTAFVVGTITLDEFIDALVRLQPSAVGKGEDFEVPEIILERHIQPVLAVWWD